MQYEKRKYKRFDIFLIVKFKPSKKASACSLGITRNFSCEGLSFESQNFDLEQRESLEFRIEHPHSDLSVSVPGYIVWKEKTRFACIMGLKFKETDKEIDSKIFELISASGYMPIDPSLNNSDLDRASGEKNEEGSVVKLSAEEEEKLMFELFEKDNEDNGPDET
jgi:hypothetical protein